MKLRHKNGKMTLREPPNGNFQHIPRQNSSHSGGIYYRLGGFYSTRTVGSLFRIPGWMYPGNSVGQIHRHDLDAKLYPGRSGRNLLHNSRNIFSAPRNSRGHTGCRKTPLGAGPRSRIINGEPETKKLASIFLSRFIYSRPAWPGHYSGHRKRPRAGTLPPGGATRSE